MQVLKDVKYHDVMLKFLRALFPTAKIYLFGSRARGTHRPNSDINIVIDAGCEVSHYDIARAKRALEALYIVQKIDVVDFHSVPPKMQEEILKDGIIWN